MSKYLILNTDDSFSTEPHNASFNISQFNESHFFSKIALIEINVPNIVYPINSNNNTLVFEEDGAATDFTATITPGAYSASELATEIKSVMDAAGANTYTITYNSITFKYTVATSGTSLRFTSDTTAGKVIGVEVSNNSFASSITSDYPVRLDTSQYIDIQCSIPSNNITSDSRPIYKRVPLRVAFGELLYASWEPDDYLPLRVGSIVSLDLRLTDDAGNAWVLPRNASVQYTFRLS